MNSVLCCRGDFKIGSGLGEVMAFVDITTGRSSKSNRLCGSVYLVNSSPVPAIEGLHVTVERVACNWHFLFIDKRKSIPISQLQNLDFREVEREPGREFVTSCSEKNWACFFLKKKFFFNWAMFPSYYAKYRCALSCWNLICGNADWHYI